MKKLLALLLLLVLTGCGAADLDEAADPGWEEYQQQEDTEQDTGPVYPGAFSLAWHKDHTLDPLTCGEGIQQDVSSLLYEPLFRLNDRFEPEGVLCESAQWDDTGLICTLNIRAGVLFSDGSELKPQDVAATLQRAMTVQRYAYRLRQVVSVKYSNRNMTVTVELAEKNTAFLSLLDIPAVKKGTEGRQVPTGTGPYIFVSDDAGTRLEINASWWQQLALPVDAIELVHAKDEDTAVHLFTADRVQLLTIDPTDGHYSVSGSALETERVTTQLHYIGFNTTRGVFSDPAARTAFSIGIQRNVLVDAFLSDHATAAWFPISPYSDLYPRNRETTWDQNAVRDAIAAAGYDTGESRELILLVNEEDSFRLDNAYYIADQMSLCDWKITVRVLPWTEYLIALEQGDFDLYYGEVRMCADWDMSDLIGTDGMMNYGGIVDPQLDQYLQEFRESEDRASAADRLCEYFSRTAPIAPICFRNFVVVTHTDVVEGLVTAPGNTFGALDQWTIHLAS